MKTRYWDNADGMTTTAVQFRDDTDPMVWMHTNVGWVQIGNTPKEADAAEKFAEDVAKQYQLTEASQEQALYMAGGD